MKRPVLQNNQAGVLRIFGPEKLSGLLRNGPQAPEPRLLFLDPGNEMKN